MRERSSRAVCLVVAMVFSACGGGPEVAAESSTTVETVTTTSLVTTTSVAETTTTTAPVEPTPLRDVEGGTRSGIGWLAEPGLYVAYVDGRTVTLDMPEAFTYVPRRTDLILAPADISPGIRIISFALTPIEGVVRADQVGTQHEDSEVNQVTEPAPEALSDWLDNLSQVTTSSPITAEGAGWVADAWDVTVDDEAGETYSCAYGRCIGTLVPKNAAVYVAGHEFGFRIWQFGDAAEGLYGFGQSPLDSLDTANAFYDMVLSALSIEE